MILFLLEYICKRQKKRKKKETIFKRFKWIFVISVYLAFLSWFESQSRPSYKPSPLVAHVAWIYQLRFRNEWRPNLSVISAAFIAFGKSYLEKKQKNNLIKKYFKIKLTCLLANIKRTASRNSSSANIRWSSSRASPTRSRSLLSTTKIKPCVFWK